MRRPSVPAPPPQSRITRSQTKHWRLLQVQWPGNIDSPVAPRVYTQTMASGMALEVDHKRGSAWVRGRPEAVEKGRIDFQNKLASLFPGDFLSVSRSSVHLSSMQRRGGGVYGCCCGFVPQGCE